MKIKLTTFDEIVDSKILERGFDYFKEGKVKNLEEIGKNYWHAIVKGSEIYNVKTFFKKDSIIIYECSCPFDFGPVCKHQVALWFAIRKHLGIKSLSPSERSNKCRKKIEKGDKAIYRGIIRASLDSASNHEGFIDYWSGMQSVKGAEDLLSEADNFTGAGKPEKAISICQVVIEELIPALQSADDSNGEIGNAIDRAFDLYFENTRRLTSRKAKDENFLYCLKEVLHSRHKGWTDWKWNIARIAAIFVNDQKKKRMLFSTVEKVLKGLAGDDLSDEYDYENAAEIKLDVIGRIDGEEKARKFIDENLDYTPIRRKAIEKSLAEKNYEQVKILAQQGIERDTKRGYDGLIVDWLEKLLLVAEKEKDNEKIRDYLTNLFFKTSKFDYYEKLKKSYSKSEWLKQVDNVLRKLKNFDSHRVDFYVLAEIYIRENRLKDLLDIVKRNLSFETLNFYHKILSTIFPHELCLLYEEEIRNELKGYTDRSIYQEVCRMLRRIKKLGENNRVSDLIKEFQETYKNRRALLEELTLV